MKTSLELGEPALVWIFRCEREPVLVAPDDKRERDEIVAWLETAYPEWASALTAAAEQTLEQPERK